MTVPERCFTCGKTVGNHYKEFGEMFEELQGIVDTEIDTFVLDKLGVK